MNFERQKCSFYQFFDYPTNFFFRHIESITSYLKCKCCCDCMAQQHTQRAAVVVYLATKYNGLLLQNLVRIAKGGFTRNPPHPLLMNTGCNLVIFLCTPSKKCHQVIQHANAMEERTHAWGKYIEWNYILEQKIICVKKIIILYL